MAGTDDNEHGIWVPFYTSVGLFMLAFHGLAYSLFPWIVVYRVFGGKAAPLEYY